MLPLLVCVSVWEIDTDMKRESERERDRQRERGEMSLATYCMLHEEINASLAAISA